MAYPADLINITELPGIFMKQSLTLNFNFRPEEEYPVILHLHAIAEIDETGSFYNVYSFQLAKNEVNTLEYTHSILPIQQIKCIKKNDKTLWVHCDSESESRLSTAIGKAIEQSSNCNVRRSGK